MATILSIIGITILMCIIGVLFKIAGFAFEIIWELIGWCFDGCFTFIAIIIIIMFLIACII